MSVFEAMTSNKNSHVRWLAAFDRAQHLPGKGR